MLLWGQLLPVLLAASAVESPWGLSWRAPPECIGPAELVLEVENRLGRPVFGADPELRIDGILKRPEAEPTWRAKLILLDKTGAVLGSRDVFSSEKDCRSLDASLTLVIAVMIDPLASLSSPSERAPDPGELPALPSPSPAPSASAPPPSAPVVRSEARPLPASPPPTRGQGVLAFEGGFGPAPAPTLGLSYSGHMGLSPSLFLELRLALYPYVPISMGTTRGALTGGGLGAALGWRGRSMDAPGWTPLVSLGLEGNGFLALATAPQVLRAELVGRADLMGRIGLQHRAGGLGFLVQLGVGGSPFVSRVRLITPDGRPEDIPMGSPLRGELGLALVFPVS